MPGIHNFSRVRRIPCMGGNRVQTKGEGGRELGHLPQPLNILPAWFTFSKY